ncbi:MAG: tetratricopeptide repeat protein [Acidobacteria bacterium]|nr:tetratricopeptide repeat protein [Acidobacteriota bacterium]
MTLRLLVAGFLVLLLNSAYLAALPSASLWYFANVALHPLLGFALAGVAGFVLLRRRWTPAPLCAAGLGVSAIGLLLGVGVMVVGAARAQRPILVAHVTVMVVGAVLLAAHLWRVAARRAQAGGGSPAAGTAVARGAAGAGAAAGAADAAGARDAWDANGTAVRALRAGLAVALLAAVAAPFVRSATEAEWRREHRIVNPTAPPATMQEEGAGPDSPFFPSSANTNVDGTIPADFFLTSEACGRCHRDIYEQWKPSAHHFSSFNNQWYRKSIEYMQDVVGTEPSKWCAGCHDHAVFFNGRFDRPIREQIDTPEAQAGLGCTSCHSIVHVGSTMGQGDFVIEYPPMHDLAASENPVLQWLHDTATHLAPGPHRKTFLKPFHTEQSAEFCSSCHKVHLDVPVNEYRWIRGFNEYDNWQASGVSGQGARSFYYPPAPQTCRDCHMPLVPSDDPAARDGLVRSHRFPGANTALPFVNGDEEQLRLVQEFLRDGQVSVDVFGITRVAEAPPPELSEARGTAEPRLSSTFAVGEESMRFGAAGISTGAPPAEVLAPLDLQEVAVRRGESVRVEVVVRTRKVGHFFPGGTVDAFDVWVEFEAVDDRGRVLLHSGAAADGGSGPVDPGAHFYRSLQLDERGNPINKRNAWMTRSVAYVRLIPPGAADTVHYRLQVPADAGDRIFLRAKVNYRKFAWWNTQWAYAGERDPSTPASAVGSAYDDGRWTFTGDTSDVSGEVKAIPDIPTTVMAEAEATLAVIGADEPLPLLAPASEVGAPAAGARPATGGPPLRERWNDYGIGLLLQGDLKGAVAAFERVIEVDPTYPDGPVNVARALLQEGDVAGAIPYLERAIALEPRLARAHFFLGTARKTLGAYDEALAHLEIAREQYPRDRVVLGQIGRIQFLDRRFEEAVATFQEVLRIDPEDLQAHYNLMLAHRGAGDLEAAGRAQALYERFKADEAAQAITGPYRRASPEDNNERQAIHEHRHGAAPH